MKSYTEELGTRDRDFEIGGEVFKWRELGWYETEALAIREEQFLAKEDKTAKDSTDFLIERILVFLDPANDSNRRFKALLKRKDDPVPHFQITELHEWLWEQVSSRPTQLPSLSSNGPGNNEASSQDE